MVNKCGLCRTSARPYEVTVFECKPAWMNVDFIKAHRDATNTRPSHICSLHFAEDSFENYLSFAEYRLAKKLILRPDAMPTKKVETSKTRRQNRGKDEGLGHGTETVTEPHQPAIKRARRDESSSGQHLRIKRNNEMVARLLDCHVKPGYTAHSRAVKPTENAAQPCGRPMAEVEESAKGSLASDLVSNDPATSWNLPSSSASGQPMLPPESEDHSESAVESGWPQPSTLSTDIVQEILDVNNVMVSLLMEHGGSSQPAIHTLQAASTTGTSLEDNPIRSQPTSSPPSSSTAEPPISHEEGENPAESAVESRWPQPSIFSTVIVQEILGVKDVMVPWLMEHNSQPASRTLQPASSTTVTSLENNPIRSQHTSSPPSSSSSKQPISREESEIPAAQDYGNWGELSDGELNEISPDPERFLQSWFLEGILSDKDEKLISVLDDLECDIGENSIKVRLLDTSQHDTVNATSQVCPATTYNSTTTASTL